MLKTRECAVLLAAMAFACYATGGIAQSQPTAPTQAEAKAAAKTAFELLQSGTSDPNLVAQTLDRLRSARAAGGLAEHQTKLLDQLVRGLEKVRKLPVDGWELGSGKQVRDDFSAAAPRRLTAVGIHARTIATEFLAVGNLADNLTQATDDFREVSTQKERLALDIRSIASPARLRLSSQEKEDLVKFVDALLVRAEPPGAPAPGSTPLTGNRAAAIKARLSQPSSSLEPIEATSDELVAFAKEFAKPLNLAEVGKYLDAVPLLVSNVTDPATRLPFNRSADEIRIRTVACRIYFWQQISNRLAGEIVKSSEGTPIDSVVLDVISSAQPPTSEPQAATTALDEIRATIKAAIDLQNSSRGE